MCSSGDLTRCTVRQLPPMCRIWAPAARSRAGSPAPAENGYVVYVPDLDINTEGESIEDAIAMAEDAIGLWGITTQDMGKEIPAPSKKTYSIKAGEVASYVLVDFDAYRRANDMRTVRKNVTIPSYLNDLAEKAQINFSQLLQEALRGKLGVE